MSISSNSIFHFTNKISSLKGILSNNFQIRYCRETIEHVNGKLEILVPIVSFCEIPISQVTNHIKSYGPYGIGLSKEWAVKKQLNPVIYIEKNSRLSLSLCHFTPGYALTADRLMNKGSVSGVEGLSPLGKYAMDFIRYIKNYQGDLIRPNKTTIENYRFSDEREWRYVLDPQIESPPLMFYNIEKTDETTISFMKEDLNKVLLKKYNLPFELKDVNYIIVNKESQRDAIIKTIKRVFEAESEANIEWLISKITSTESIMNDI